MSRKTIANKPASRVRGSCGSAPPHPIIRQEKLAEEQPAALLASKCWLYKTFASFCPRTKPVGKQIGTYCFVLQETTSLPPLPAELFKASLPLSAASQGMAAFMLPSRMHLGDAHFEHLNHHVNSVPVGVGLGHDASPLLATFPQLWHCLATLKEIRFVTSLFQLSIMTFAVYLVFEYYVWSSVGRFWISIFGTQQHCFIPFDFLNAFYNPLGYLCFCIGAPSLENKDSN